MELDCLGLQVRRRLMKLRGLVVPLRAHMALRQLRQVAVERHLRPGQRLLGQFSHVQGATVISTVQIVLCCR